MATGGDENKKNNSNTKKNKRARRLPSMEFRLAAFLRIYLSGCQLHVCAVCVSACAGVCVCVSQSSIKLFVLFGQPFLLLSAALFICLKRNYCAGQRVGKQRPPLPFYPLTTLTPHLCQRLPCNFVVPFNAFAIAHCICWHFLCQSRDRRGGGREVGTAATRWVHSTSTGGGC